MRQVKAKKLRKLTKKIYTDKLKEKGVSFKKAYNVIKEKYKMRKKAQKEKNGNKN